MVKAALPKIIQRPAATFHILSYETPVWIIPKLLEKEVGKEFSPSIEVPLSWKMFLLLLLLLLIKLLKYFYYLLPIIMSFSLPGMTTRKITGGEINIIVIKIKI